MADEKEKDQIEKIDAQANADGVDPTVGDAQSTAVDPATEVATLREQLQAKEKECNENYDRYLRQVAELENFRKRANRDTEEAIRFANERLVKDLLALIDSLERAVAHAKGGGNGKPLVEGVEMVLRGFFDTLGKYGVVPIVAVGQRFDPEKHEAMAQIESGNYEPN